VFPCDLPARSGSWDRQIPDMSCEGGVSGRAGTAADSRPRTQFECRSAHDRRDRQGGDVSDKRVVRVEPLII